MLSPCATSVQSLSDETGINAGPEAKRRKVRKGTFSCWECKRRKMKCIFEPVAHCPNGPCNGCRRRGLKCIGQEFPEDSLFTNHAHRKSDDVWKFKKSLHQSSSNASNRSVTSDREPTTAPKTPTTDAESEVVTSASLTSEPSKVHMHHGQRKHSMAEHDDVALDFEHSQRQARPNAPNPGSKFEKLSVFLHESFPSHKDMDKIFMMCGQSSHHPSVLAHQILTLPYVTFDETGFKLPKSLMEVPGPEAHPVLIARHMLKISIFLQQLSPQLLDDTEGLSQSPRSIMQSLAGHAIKLVTTDDELLGSIEGLECVMIEAMYHVNVGNLRRGWVANRKAMTIAQLMGVNRSHHQTHYKVLDPKTKYDPQNTWFRIIFIDRQLCLMLGLPQGSLDRSMGSDAIISGDIPLGHLERKHCVIASHILERNELRPSSHDLSLTQNLDIELQKAARSLPSKWWLPPKMDGTTTDSETLYWDTLRLYAQITHYNLLNQLHLPYMLRSSVSEHKDEYSRITCVNASREVLSRFISLRNFNRIAYSCRIIDFLALMAAMTLLLAHLDSQRSSEVVNLLAHQYHSDRAMIEKAQDNMQEINRLNSDALSAQSADLLQRLLTLGVETPAGSLQCEKEICVQEVGADMEAPGLKNNVGVSVHIPYFGIITIARQGVTRKITSDARGEVAPEPSRIPSSNFDVRMVNIEPTQFDHGYVHVESDLTAPTEQDSTELETPGVGTSNTAAECGPQLHDEFSHQLLSHEEFPGLTAGGDDWAFQGVDMAFFDNLIRSSGDDLDA